MQLPRGMNNAEKGLLDEKTNENDLSTSIGPSSGSLQATRRACAGRRLLLPQEFTLKEIDCPSGKKFVTGIASCGSLMSKKTVLLDVLQLRGTSARS
jgi:hypothetical protein